MKLTPDKCPVCGEDAAYMIEQVYGRAGLLREDDGNFEYDGGTDMDWNTQEPVRDDDETVTLHCPHRHSWQAKLEREEEDCHGT